LKKTQVLAKTLRQSLSESQGGLKTAQDEFDSGRVFQLDLYAFESDLGLMNSPEQAADLANFAGAFSGYERVSLSY
jgi:hypothetical protein